MITKTWKWIGAVFITTTLLAGCAGGSSAPTGDTGTEPITLTFFGADSSPQWNNMKDEVGQEIIKRTGVTLNAEFAVSGGGKDRLSLMAASGEYPDLISAKTEVSKLVDAGAMLDLTDLIEEHAPNLKKMFGPHMNRLKYSLEDPSIYVIPSYSQVDQTTFDATSGFEIQHKVLKELGYPEVKTVKDFENVLRTYYEKHPTTNGGPTIPLTLDADDWRIMITVTNAAFLTTGAPDDGEYFIDPNTYEAKLHYKRPEAREYFRWLNHMSAEGLLDKESFVQKSDQYKSKIASGRVLGLIDAEWGYQDAEDALKAAGMEDSSYAHFPVTLTEEYKDHSFQDAGFLSGYGVGITTSCPDPVRAIKFLDFLASDEGQVLVNWGIEGKHYVVEDGKRVIPENVLNEKVNNAINFKRTTGIELYSLMSGRYGDGVKDATGNYYTTRFPEQIIESYSEPEKETLAAYGATTWKDLYPGKEEFPVKPWGAAYNMTMENDSSYAVAFEKTQDIIRKRIPEAILTSPDNFDAVYDTMLGEVDAAGAIEMEQEYSKMVQERVKLWNGES
ncbi:ABC transporter substrate-binding protein [Paenibacillus massiliensis]|uniref:ABC transporter substrate-binding protein n=1 Tax=Paenibacillus massiliensis TaxID=225917 RepID=UPI00046EF8F0|nr:ABC transporter substrate-binding protein [Paenibacillus massiliensis]